MASQALPETSSNPLAGIAALLQSLGGTQQTTNPGNVAPLQDVLSKLQGQDFNALLQSVFQQAGGQIPGLQQAYANAIGARSGGNSAVQAALNELLKQTTLAGQQQVANQQAQNLQTQQAAAANIAANTRGTKSTSGTNMKQAGSALAALQLLSMLMPKSGQGQNGGEDQGLFGELKNLASRVGQGINDVFTPAQNAAAIPASTPLGTGITTGAGGAPGFTTAGMFGSGDFTPAFTGYTPVDYSLSGGGADFGGMGFQIPEFDFGPVGFENYQPVDFSNIFTGGGGLGFQGDFDLNYSW